MYSVRELPELSAWRMYFVQRGQVLIVMLGGGTKATQEADIARAKKLAASLESES